MIFFEERKAMPGMMMNFTAHKKIPSSPPVPILKASIKLLLRASMVKNLSPIQ